MASKLLSNTLPRAAFSNKFVRPLATAASQTTRTTVLPNGFTVATEEHGSTGTATVGVWINAGSRAETASTNGAANFIQAAALKNNASTFEKLGGGLNANTSREQTYYASQANAGNLDATVAGLSELVSGDIANIDSVRGSVLKQQVENDNNLEQVTFDHLHAMAYQGESLGRPVVGVKETVEALTKEDLSAFKKENYAADRMVLVGAGNVDHDALVRLAEKTFGQLTNTGVTSSSSKPAFTGSEIRLRDDVLPQAHIALAVEGASYLSADYFSLAVMSTLIGSWDQNLGAAANLSSRLSTIVHDNHLANSFTSFNKGYKDTGLWGLYFTSDNKLQLDDFVHFAQKEWIRLSTTVTESEVERAKQQLQASLLLQLDSNQAIAQDIGSQVLTTGKRLSADEIKQAVQKVSLADVRNAGNKYLWDQEVVVTGVGPVECLTDYNRVRGFMSYNRF
ncbi:Metalloenzyme, LuxS/M16 peptidase-like protein [Halteromyces radiatus]|uniref:Metalloenzyme, LuxS/M16 peptidase-like protein n=1 Tax=Halteromyces radiatus TaxID=101107 RepID=UPI00221F222A|nr:Metalloenzyme, LuxS/M16 peptidase-like protein [Halteromyces radiatus]KAI8081608.1 Metalloenzyme, LuxS/M16 peptidase-like protein [Halteromyces radiatus]